VSWFIYQPKTEPILTTGEVITENKWHQAWSEPVRIKPGVRAQYQPFLIMGPVAPTVEQVLESKWHQAWSNPSVLTKRALPISEQQALAFQFPFVKIDWFAWLSEPKRFKPMLITADQPFVHQDLIPPSLLTFDWFTWLSEPVRIRPGLRKELQQPEFFNTFIPIIYTALMQATERRDLFLASLYKNNQAQKAIVSIKVRDF